MKEVVEKLPGLLRGSAELPLVIAVVGSDDFLKRDAAQQILDHLYGESIPAEDVTRLTGERTTSADDLVPLFDELRTPSLFGGSRTVLVERAETYLRADADAWANFFATTWAGGRLVLFLDELDGRTKVAKRLEAVGWVLTAEKPFHRPPPWTPNAKPWENGLNRWIVERARTAGLQLDPPTAHLLQTRVGTHLSDLAQTIARLATVLPEGGRVSRDDVERHTPAGEDTSLFELIDTVFLDDPARSLRLTRELLERGSNDPKGPRVTDPAALLLQFVGGCLRRIRQLRTIHTALRERADDATLMRVGGIARPFLPRIKEQARATPPEALETLVRELRAADADLKLGRGPQPAELLERIVVRRYQAAPLRRTAAGHHSR
ncbi:MAG: DNA polymerase III subunit delta [Planctomycetota bacterium]